MDKLLLQAQRARDDRWRRLEGLAQKYRCRCGGGLVVVTELGDLVLKCGNCGSTTDWQRERTWTEKWRTGEAIPIEIANRLEKKYGKEKRMSEKPNLETEIIHMTHGMKTEITYMPCYGTHGNQGKVIGECPFCHNPLYEKEVK